MLFLRGNMANVCVLWFKDCQTGSQVNACYVRCVCGTLICKCISFIKFQKYTFTDSYGNHLTYHNLNQTNLPNLLKCLPFTQINSNLAFQNEINFLIKNVDIFKGFFDRICIICQLSLNFGKISICEWYRCSRLTSVVIC